MNKFYITLLFLIISLSGCEWFGKADESANIDQSNLYLLNVNDPESFQDARIKGSININFDDLERKTKDLNKSAKIIVYCTNYACTESDRVAKKLKKLGFEDILVYRGGIQEWYQLSLKDDDKYSFEGSATQKFLNMPIEKFEQEETVPTIDAEKLSILLKESQEN